MPLAFIKYSIQDRIEHHSVHKITLNIVALQISVGDLLIRARLLGGLTAYFTTRRSVGSIATGTALKH